MRTPPKRFKSPHAISDWHRQEKHRKTNEFLKHAQAGKFDKARETLKHIEYHHKESQRSQGPAFSHDVFNKAGEAMKKHADAHRKFKK